MVRLVLRGLLSFVFVLFSFPLFATALAPFIDLQEQGLTVVEDGEGLADWSSPVNLDVNVGGTVRFALLYWTGADTDCPVDGFGACTHTEPYLDQQVIFNGTPLTGTIIGTEQEGTATVMHFGYFADVTSIVSAAGPGAHSFTFADGNGASNFDVRSGVSLLVAYTNASDMLTYRVLVQDGLDFADANADLPEAQTTQTVTFNHAAVADSRSGQLLILAGGGEVLKNDTLTISNNATIANSLNGSDGPFWDSDMRTITIPAATASTTVQLSSTAGAAAEEFEWAMAMLRVPAVVDTVPPSCSGITTTGPPMQRTFTIEDDGSGLASILVTQSNNADTVVPPFLPGTTDPVNVVSTKINQVQPMSVTIQLADLAGNTGVCRFSDAAVEVHIEKTDFSATATAGDTVSYTIEASNIGTGTVSDITVADTLPATLSGVTWTASQSGGASGFTTAGSGNINDTGISMPAGSTITWLVSGTLDSGASGFLSNTATITPGSADDTSDNSATDNDTIVSEAALTLTKSAGTALAGHSITWTLVATNEGPSDAVNVVIEDTLPAGVTFVSVNQTAGTTSFSCGESTGVVTCTATTFPAGESATFEIAASIPPSTSPGTVIENTAMISSPTMDPEDADNAAGTSSAVAAAPAAAAIPALDPSSLAMLALLLAMAGVIATRMRG